MSEKKDDIISKNNELDPIVYQILNEAYHEFKQMYGDKHSPHIKKQIENFTDKIKKDEKNYYGAIASARIDWGIIYAYSDDLPAVLKHELWHIYNNVSTDREKSLKYIPKRYLDKLQQNGYLEEMYNQTMERYKKILKDDVPDPLGYFLVDFEKFRDDRFDFGNSVVEMWTEWFNSQTHLKNMKENFWNWGDGYFTKTNSSGSFYDSYLNIASIISCIIPKEKLLEMYLQTSEYKTDYSYPEMLEEFDLIYLNSLDEEEHNQYQYPYLKIIMDKMVIDENARKNPVVAQKALQSSMKTCFNAYLEKLEILQDIDVDKAKEIYAEIKYMQEQMVWNLDMSKMNNLDYIKALSKVQDKFKNMMQNLGLENSEVKEMFEKIDYTQDNPFKMIEDGEKIAEKIKVTEKEKKDKLTNIDEYKTNVGEDGIRNNLYNSLFTFLGNSKYNLLYENFQGENELNNYDNILLKIHKQIETTKTDEDVINMYNQIYELYINKIETTLKTDENIENLFDVYSKEIVELQKNGLFNEKNQKYLPKLEQIIDIYNEKLKKYEKRIDKSTEKEIQRDIQEGRTIEDAKRFSEKVPNICKKELNEHKDRIVVQRKKQIEKYEEIEQNESIIGKEDVKQEINSFIINEDGEIIRPNNQITEYKEPLFLRIKKSIKFFFQDLMKGSESTHDPIGNVVVNIITKMNNQLLKSTKKFFIEGKKNIVFLAQTMYEGLNLNEKDTEEKETGTEKKEKESQNNDFKDRLAVDKQVKDNMTKATENFEFDIEKEQKNDSEIIKQVEK